MSSEFYTILTNIGKAKLANAQVLGTCVNLTQMALGDGNGSYYNPTEDQTALVNEVWRGVISEKLIDEDNPTWVVLRVVLPTDIGGFYIREVGIYDDQNDLIGIGKIAETYKPTINQGSAKDLLIETIFEISNTENVTISIDPTAIIATKDYVDSEISRKLDEFLAEYIASQQGKFKLLNSLTIDDISNLSNTNIALYTSGSNYLRNVNICITNRNNFGSAKVDLAHITGNLNSLTNSTYILKNRNLSKNETLNVKIYGVSAGETIAIKSDSTNMNFAITGETFTQSIKEKKLARLNIDTANTDQIVYATPADKMAKISFYICNKNTQSANISLALINSANISALTPKDYIFFNHKIESNKTRVYDLELEMFKNSILSLKSDKTDVNIIVYGLETETE